MSWRVKHGEVIDEFLSFLNNRTDAFVLKGGTGLKKCYNLDRFSEDIDLDVRHGKLVSHLKLFCDQKQYTFSDRKNSSNGERYFIQYGNIEKPLKVETSHRRKDIPDNEITKVNGITVYTLEYITIGKLNAFQQRDKIRDLYDVTFIVNNYLDQLSEQTKMSISNALDFKGLHQFDYLVKTGSDELIDNEKLAEDVLLAFENLGLFYTEDELPSVLSDDDIHRATYEEIITQTHPDSPLGGTQDFTVPSGGNPDEPIVKKSNTLINTNNR